MDRTDFGKELIESAEEALAIAQGKAEPAAVHVIEADRESAAQRDAHSTGRSPNRR